MRRNNNNICRTIEFSSYIHQKIMDLQVWPFISFAEMFIFLTLKNIILVSSRIYFVRGFSPKLSHQQGRTFCWKIDIGLPKHQLFGSICDNCQHVALYVRRKERFTLVDCNGESFLLLLLLIVQTYVISKGISYALEWTVNMCFQDLEVDILVKNETLIGALKLYMES